MSVHDDCVPDNAPDGKGDAEDSSVGGFAVADHPSEGDD